MQRERMDYDVVIVGAGPAGLSAAIRLKQCAQTLSVCVLEKGAEVGAHILSGAVIETRALDELLPNWRELGAPIQTQVTDDEFCLLTPKRKISLPTPPGMRNHNNYIVSLSDVTRWLAEQAQALGIEIYPGFAASELFFNDQHQVAGVITGEMGLTKQGKQKPGYQNGMIIAGKITLLAEGCHGSLTKQAIAQFNLRQNRQPQTYALGIKELWQVDNPQYKPGSVLHSVGWPLDSQTYGGSFLYHLDNNQIAVGFVVGLDYHNPTLDPFQELQRFKTHPSIKSYFANGERIAYGARALNEGGWQSIPQCHFPGGLLIGCAAGFLNVAKLKGTHTAMYSGMLAAEQTVAYLLQSDQDALNQYETRLKSSWLGYELHQVRNIRPAFRKGLWAGLSYAAIDSYLLRGKAPWTFSHRSDHDSLNKRSTQNKINYPLPDKKLTFDKLSSVYLSNTNHQEDQPCHLQLKDGSTALTVNFQQYDSPEQYYCPAGVYEIVGQGEQATLQINAQNCVHCKTCDIKDPTQNITWVPPEGGGGPNYRGM